MSKLWPKVIRDPVHNIIPFEDTPCDHLLLDLINTKEFQRLRRIKQLGMSDLVFPGANHSRFAHSIGVMHVARRMMDRVSRLVGEEIDEDQQTAVLVAALLHDIGHGPFSHAFEKVTGQHHEARTLEIIQGDETEIGKRLRASDLQLPDRLAAFFDEDIDTEQEQGREIPKYLTQIVSSQLDADRFDYLLRDTHATGTDYGRFDLDWLISQLFVDQERRRFYIGSKAIDAAEAYIFARYHMYRVVYYHKTVRAAEVMVRLCMKRYRQLMNIADSDAKSRQIVPDAPPAVLEAFGGEGFPLDCYLALNDQTMTEFFKACSGASDSILNELGAGLVHRTLYKAVDVTGFDLAPVAEFSNQAHDLLRQKGLDKEFAFVHDTPADTPYKPYDPDSSKPASQIYVESEIGKTVEISTKAKALKQLQEQYRMTRYYVPEAIRDEIDKIADTTLREEKS